MDVQGGEAIYKKFPNWHYIFLEPPSLEDCKARLETRGIHKPSELNLRLKNAEKDLKKVKDLLFYHVIVNNKVEDCFEELVKYINKKYMVLIEMERK